jgi:hypothetical protein
MTLQTLDYVRSKSLFSRPEWFLHGCQKITIYKESEACLVCYLLKQTCHSMAVTSTSCPEKIHNLLFKNFSNARKAWYAHSTGISPAGWRKYVTRKGQSPSQGPPRDPPPQHPGCKKHLARCAGWDVEAWGASLPSRDLYISPCPTMRLVSVPDNQVVWPLNLSFCSGDETIRYISNHKK